MNLLPFQIETVKRKLEFLHKNKSVYNASEQGLGKTIETCAVINELAPDSILIICPAVMRYTWEEEVNKWTDLVFAYDINIITSSRSHINYGIKHPVINIISYQLCEPMLEAILVKNWDLLILDEAHYVKSLKAKRTKAILGEIWPKANYKIALSGTPVTNNVIDGFTLFNRMAPTIFPTFHKFAGEYSYQKRTIWGIKYYGIRNAEKLKDLIRKNFFIRYTKEEVLPELPEKIFQKIILPESLAVLPPISDKDKLIEAAKSLKAAIIEGSPPGNLPMVLQTQRRLQGEKKVPAVLEFVKNLLDEGHSVILFGYHKSVIAKYVEALKEYDPQVITGETPGKLRKLAVDNFVNGKSNLFIGNLVAAGIGITLIQKDNPMSANVVLAELDWAPAVISQAIARAHRIGTKTCVNIYYFIVKDSIDADIETTVVSKIDSFNKFIEN